VDVQGRRYVVTVLVDPFLYREEHVVALAHLLPLAEIVV
jgi:hypothetical protein